MKTRLALLLLLGSILTAAFGAAPANAEGLGLHAESAEGEFLEDGAELQALSENFTITAGELEILCNEVELQSLLLENGGESSTSALIGGHFSGSAEGGRCETSTALTASIGGIEAPWIFEFQEGGELTLQGEEGGPLSIEATLYLEETPIATCTFEAPSLHGEFPYGEPLGLTLPTQEMTGSGICSESAFVSGTFAVTSEAQQVVPDKGKTVTLRAPNAGGAAIAVNSQITGGNNNKLVLKHNTGNVECNADTFSGKVLRNAAASAEVEIIFLSLTTGGGRCTTTFTEGGVGVTATLTPENVPWTMYFYPSGFGRINGSPTIELEEAFFKGNEVNPLRVCRLTGMWPETNLGMSFPITPPKAFGLSLGGHMPLNAMRSAATCPGAGDLSVEFSVSTGVLIPETVVATTP